MHKAPGVSEPQLGPSKENQLTRKLIIYYERLTVNSLGETLGSYRYIVIGDVCKDWPFQIPGQQVGADITCLAQSGKRRIINYLDIVVEVGSFCRRSHDLQKLRVCESCVNQLRWSYEWSVWWDSAWLAGANKPREPKRACNVCIKHPTSVIDMLTCDSNVFR
jgi:hypothetical protein